MTQKHANFLNINNFLEHSLYNDNKMSTGPLRINRFMGIMDSKHLKINEMNLAWNIYKVNCPAITLDIETREVDMVPKIYFKNWAYSDLEISYVESSDLLIRNLFYGWMKKIVSPDHAKRDYYDEVKAEHFKLFPLDNNGNAHIQDVFYEVTPFSIDSVNFDMGDSGEQVALTTIKFKYLRHEVIKL